MPLSAYVQRVIEASQALPGVDPPAREVLERFIRAVGAQLRPPFVARHSPQTAAELFLACWGAIQRRPGSDVQVSGQLGAGSAGLLTLMPDQPFIVDTVRLAIRQAGGSWVSGFNAVLPIGRDADGGLLRVDHPGDPLESLVRVEADDLDGPGLAALVTRLHRSLRLAQGTVADFQAMTEAIDAAAYQFHRLADRTPDQGEDLRETSELLRWLLADNFVLMGVRSADLALGVQRPELAALWGSEPTTGWADGGAYIQVRKAQQESPVHRAGRIDELRVEVPSSSGTPRVLHIEGLFTYRAVTQPSRHVPLLRRVLAGVLRGQGSKPGSYRYKGIANVFDSLPTEFLFTASHAQIADTVERVLEAEQENDVRVHIVQTADGHTTFALAAMPRERWSDQLRAQIQQLLQDRTRSSHADHGVYVGRYQTMLVHFYLTGTSALEDEAVQGLRREIGDLATPWEARLYGALVRHFGEPRADELLRRYGRAFDAHFQQVSPPDRTARDIELLERTPDQAGIEADLFLDGAGRVNLRIYQSADIILSTLLPVLDDFGLVVIDQYADEVRPQGRPALTVDTFRLRGVAGISQEALLERGPLLTDALRAAFSGKMPVDVLCRVLLRAAIPWEAVDLLRAYNGYARQLGLRYTLARVQEILLDRPALVGKLWAAFQARFDPDLGGDRAALVRAADEAAMDDILQITDHDQDVLFRTILNLIEATLRTNFYRTDRKEHYISFKVEAARVKSMPEPRLQYEIYVHHREMEGVHLRGGKVARGGIRWSDREDYRREVLDLATTQMTKNVLIVPEGAKGGFFIKKLVSDRAGQREQADRLYTVLVRGMLDITDNIVDGKVVHPPRVLVRDGEDPYLVVAADKGTAHLSDTANGLSQAYGFWLDDAFASGGSNGYDHKKVGITARGGWMTVRRLFAEMGLDPHRDPFTCVGVGDPAGDVFGNGVIEHPTMKLLAAFNHLHIFFDPNPDPVRSFAERKRLFDAAKGWDHYDTSTLSPGGGIFSRRAKSVKLTPEIKQLLGVLQDELPVDEVLRHILRLNVDLLWNGGIGTYVKASHQSHRDANDPTNDEVRVDANTLRCKVVGEGGNLGFTQAGRIEYALHGGRLHTDFIDNSGGVDMSDHEVNLKILLTPMVRQGRLGLDERNVLLEQLTEQVARDVLANNDRHARQLGLDQLRSARDPMLYSRLIDWVCRHSKVTRASLSLPGDDDLRRRAAARQGLTRPELAILQAHVKMHVFKDLERSDSALIPGFAEKVRRYFPDAVQQRFPDDIDRHMLRQAIGMTVVVNEIAGESGALFLPLVQELTGRSYAEIARAWSFAMQQVGAAELRAELAALPITLEARTRTWVQVTDAVNGLVGQWLSAGEPGPDTEDAARIGALLTRVVTLSGSALEGRMEASVQALVARDLPRELALRIAALGELWLAREVALDAPSDPEAALVVRYAVGEASRLLPAIRGLEERRADGGWDPIAVGILKTRYIRLLRDLCRTVEVGAGVQLGVDRLTDHLGAGALGPVRDLMEHILGEHPGIPALLVAEERVRAWITGRGR